MWATMVIDNKKQFDCLCKSKIATEEEKKYRRKTQLANNQYYQNNKTDKLLIKKIRNI